MTEAERKAEEAKRLLDELIPYRLVEVRNVTGMAILQMYGAKYIAAENRRLGK